MEYYVVGRSIDGTVYLGELYNTTSRQDAPRLTLDRAEVVLQSQRARNAMVNVDSKIGHLHIVPVKGK
jgi:hypothetical protein